MKTAISVPDDVFAEAERLARRLKKSRSQLYSEALAQYLACHDEDAVTQAWDRVCSEVGRPPDPWLAEVARRRLVHAEW